MPLDGDVHGTLPQQAHGHRAPLTGKLAWKAVRSMDPAFTLEDIDIRGHAQYLSRIHCPDCGFLKLGLGTDGKGPSDFPQLLCSDVT